MSSAPPATRSATDPDRPRRWLRTIAIALVTIVVLGSVCVAVGLFALGYVIRHADDPVAPHALERFECQQLAHGAPITIERCEGWDGINRANGPDIAYFRGRASISSKACDALRAIETPIEEHGYAPEAPPCWPLAQATWWSVDCASRGMSSTGTCVECFGQPIDGSRSTRSEPNFVFPSWFVFLDAADRSCRSATVMHGLNTEPEQIPARLDAGPRGVSMVFR